MAAKKRAGDAQSGTGKEVERMVVQLAGQLGWLVGTIQARADDLLENPQLRTQVTKVRDGANEILKLANRATVRARRTARVQRAAKKTRARP
jgi:isopentenyl diphosphate isomerase/L-lactate dehydrogenase-like FMN-dependent dehydrogenase